MNTWELRRHMINDLARIDYDISKDEAPVDAAYLDTINNSYVFFDDIENGYWDGSYYFVKNDFYYQGRISRGKKEIYRQESNLKDFLFEDYSQITYCDIAIPFSWVTHWGGLSKDRVARIKKLELLKRIDDYYYEKAYEHTIRLIKKLPEEYDDGLGLRLDLSLLDRVRVKSDEELTSELREQVVSDVGLMGYDITRDEGKTLFFSDVEQGDKDGVYVFARLEHLYRNTTYKGVIRQGERYMSDIDYSGNILRELYSGIAFDLACQYVETVHLGSLSKRRVLRIKQGELLKRIASYYCDMVRLETRNEMRKHPKLYNDNRGDNLDPSLLEHLTPKKHH